VSVVVAGRLPIRTWPSRRRLELIGAGLAVAIGSGTSPAAEASAGGAKTSRVSVTSHEAQSNGWSLRPSLSRQGRFVAFESEASNLIRRDTNGVYDIFIRDRKRGTTRRVSVSSRGGQANADSTYPAISANGRFIAFQTRAGLIPGDTNGRRDLFVHDRRAHETRLAGRRGFNAVIADTGRFVAFESVAARLAPRDTNRRRDVFVRDLRTGRTRLVSVSTAGKQGEGRSSDAAISAHGRFVAFESKATNLVHGDTNVRRDIFVRDRETGRTERVSISSTGRQADGPSDSASLSADGRFVAFRSKATNLIPHDTNQQRDVFVHDRATGETSRVSFDSAGSQMNRSSGDPSISADGRFVAFGSFFHNFLHDRVTGETTRVDVSSTGVPSDNASGDEPAISADGRFVAFSSTAQNLVRRDTNSERDIFVRGPLR
jgi:Tol biopolymer transport system component